LDFEVVVADKDVQFIGGKVRFPKVLKRLDKLSYDDTELVILL
jgi:hypothetical protein